MIDHVTVTCTVELVGDGQCQAGVLPCGGSAQAGACGSG